MSVLVETSKGELVIDLFVDKAPKTCFNFIKLCQLKWYNQVLVTSVQKSHTITFQKLDETVDSDRPPVINESVWSLTQPDKTKKYFDDEIWKRKFNKKGLVATANTGPNQNTGSFFILTRPEDQEELKEFRSRHTIFGEIAEGLEVLDTIESVFTVGEDNRPLQNIRIKHTMVIEDPFENKEASFGIQNPIRYPSRSPSPQRSSKTAKSLQDL